MPPLRPFPFPSLSIGTDIAHTPRIARLVRSHRTRPRFLRRVLTGREERDFHLRFPQDHKTKHDSAQTQSLREESSNSDGLWLAEAARFLAGRWAAKEAIVKACSWRKLTFDEIQVLKERGGKRVFGVILDRADVSRMAAQDGQLEPLGNEEEEEEPAGQVVQISISHDGEYATAVCLAAKESSGL